MARKGRYKAVLFNFHGFLIFQRKAAERVIMSIHEALSAGLKNGTLNPVIGQEIPLADASRAHRVMMESRADGKIVLIP